MLKRLVKKAAITGGLEAATLMRRAGLMTSARGLGAIFTLHHVRPFKPRRINPNHHLEITPDFLEQALLTLKAEGYRFVRLQDVPALIASGDKTSRFAAFTLDDGYRDNRDHALPVFERHGVPHTIFICKGFSERSHGMWWETADAMANGAAAIGIDTNGRVRHLPLGTTKDRYAAFAALCSIIDFSNEAEAIGKLDRAARAAGVDPLSIPAQQVMNAEELKSLSRHPLVSLGAHTVSHRALSHLDDAELAGELSESADYVETITGTRPAAFAYPYGDRRGVTLETMAAVRKAGFQVAVTTMPGTLVARHGEAALALPRISLNGYYQKPRYVSALASGIPFKLKKV